LKKTKRKIYRIYKRLYDAFGPRNWWPGDSPFEIMVGAILTQNTSWRNVEKAINNLKKRGLLRVDKLYRLNENTLKTLIKPSGFYNIKAKRIKNYLKFLKLRVKKIKDLTKIDPFKLRAELLDINGIGKETADSILLYALNKPIFVIDAYTKRMCSRHGLSGEGVDYDTLQALFMNNLPNNYKMFNEYHALIVELGKRYCRSKKPLCDECPLKGI